MVNRSARTLWLRNIQPTLVVLARLVVGATFVFSRICQVRSILWYVVEDTGVFVGVRARIHNAHISFSGYMRRCV